MPAPVNMVLPAITGAPTDGVQLSVSNGTWTNSPTSFAYQWQRLNSIGQQASVTNIAGATLATYALALADVGQIVQAVVTATNGSGSTPATSLATALVGEPSANQTTLSQLMTNARLWSDTVNDGHITDAELIGWINYGMRELHDILVEAYEEILTVITQPAATAAPGPSDIPIVFNQVSYRLPYDLYKLMGVDYLFGNRGGNLGPYQFTMPRFMPRERNRFQGPYAPLITGRIIASILVPEYRLRGQYIDVIPQPSQQMAGGSMRLYYVKQFSNLVNTTDLVDASIPNGWEQYAALTAAAQALLKQERDPSGINAERNDIRQRIKDASQVRDAGEPIRITDVNRLW